MKTQFDMQENQLKDGFMMEQARVEDTEQVLSLLVETAQWFKERGSTQWYALLEGVDSHRTAEAVQRGDVFVCKVADEVVGMVMLLQQPSEWDRDLWALQEDAANDAIYLHRLAIRRKYANEHLGEAILTWCQQSIRFEGKKKIRLDCVADNAFLNAFYRRKGYTYIGERAGYSMFELML